VEQIKSDDWHSRYNLGLVQFLARHYTDAIQTLKPLTDGASPNPGALNLLAAVYEANQQTPQAVAALQRATQLTPHEVNNYLDLAALSLDHGAFQVGVDVLTAALKMVPDSPALYIERGVLYVQMGQFNEADADFQKANTVEPAQNIGTVARGISLVQENELGRSLETVRERLKQAPNDPILNYLLAEVLIRRGVRPGTPEFEEAEQAARRAVHNKPDFALAYDVLSVLYLRAGQTSQAVDVARLALKADPEDSAAVYHLIVCLRKEGDKRELAQLVKKLAEISTKERERTTAVNRYKLVEEAARSAPSTHSD
jgi:tetratricopeptide (TPR) repeat protein